MATIRLNRANFYHNLTYLSKRSGGVEHLAIVLKDNAYGHGLEEIAHLASVFGVKHAVVKDSTEAERISRLFETILILGGDARNHPHYTFALNSLEAIGRAEVGSKVELKVDTGMHRNGILPHELEEALGEIRARGLELVGVMTHFRSADELSSEFFWQSKQFDAVKQRLKEAGFGGARFHSHNSAGLLRTACCREDLVRVGIGAYGYSELSSPFESTPLKPVLSLYATRVATRRLHAGERVGYGGDFVASEEMEVSTYDLGYGDGWFRGQSATPFVTAEGLAVVGRVSMDFITLPSRRKEVCILRDAQAVAVQFGTISYEILTALSPQIPRVVV